MLILLSKRKQNKQMLTLLVRKKQKQANQAKLKLKLKLKLKYILTYIQRETAPILKKEPKKLSPISGEYAQDL